MAVCNYRQVDEALTPIREQYLHVRREVPVSYTHLDVYKRQGLICVISVKLQEAEFEGQTKAKLGNTEIRTLVSNMVYSKPVSYTHLRWPPSSRGGRGCAARRGRSFWWRSDPRGSFCCGS